LCFRHKDLAPKVGVHILCDSSDTAVSMSSQAPSTTYNSFSEDETTDIATHGSNAAETARRMTAMIEKIIADFPRRLATSDSERGAQEQIETWLQDAGLFTRYESFRYNKSLYA